MLTEISNLFGFYLVVLLSGSVGSAYERPGYVSNTTSTSTVVRPVPLSVQVSPGLGLNLDSLREGHDAYLECVIHGTHAPHLIQWLHDGVIIVPNTSTGIIQNGHRLILQRVSERSAGSYSCYVENRFGNATSNMVNIVVQRAEVQSERRDNEEYLKGKSSNSPPRRNTVLPASAPSTNTQREESVARKKCREYSRWVYKTETSATLISDNTEVRVDKCVYSEGALILGGSITLFGEFPHMALLGYGDSNNPTYQCGGSLISEDFVLTAAHCTQREMPSVVLLGEYRLGNEEDGANPQRIQVQNITVHPKYSALSYYYDVALIRLQRQPQLGPRVRPACLHTGEPPHPQPLIATGWGATAFGDDLSEELRKVSLDEVSRDSCDSAYRSSAVGNRLSAGILNEQQLCAGRPGKDTCTGDSGGPLQVYRRDPYCMFDIVGVTSFGQGCGVKRTPGVYARVQYFVKWIEDIVWPAPISALPLNGNSNNPPNQNTYLD